jgi:two-component system, OmpR family, sensor kinase
LGDAFDAMVDRLLEALSTATASEERMRQFLADASHELRTPVTVVRGATQVLLRQGAAGRPEVEGMLRDIYTEAVRLSRLVDDLLTLSRIDAGQSLAPEKVQVHPFLYGFVEQYGQVWPERSIEIDERDMNNAAAWVDPEALRRIVTNLVDNAARYSRPDGTIALAGEAVNGTVSIRVMDEGPGIPPEEAAHLFDRFYRANKSRSRQSGGTGLGLSIVQGLVEGSAGTIEIDTAPDRGTTISVTLPRAPA